MARCRRRSSTRRSVGRRSCRPPESRRCLHRADPERLARHGWPLAARPGLATHRTCALLLEDATSRSAASIRFGDNRFIDPDGLQAQPFHVHDGFGIFASFNFPNKPYLTCVRDQSVRGACTAFATTSATEMAIARATGTAVNLSEQDIWEHYNLALWGGNPVFYGESGTAKTIVSGIIANGYGSRTKGAGTTTPP